MAPSRPAQLDEISEAIGELKGSIKGIERYIHQERHGVNNLAQKVDGLGVSIGKDIAAVEARIEVRLSDMDGRIGALEQVRFEQRGATNLVEWLFRHWPGVLGFIMVMAMLLRNGQFKL